jgi:peptide chain release factor 1
MSEVSPKVLSKLQELASHYDRLEHSLSDPQVVSDHQLVREISVKRAGLAPTIELYREYLQVTKQLADNRQMLAEETDKDLIELIEAEQPQLQERADRLIKKIVSELVTADDRSVGSVILEVRAGTGGAEAALWAGDLLEMYQRYSVIKGWTLSILEISPGEQGGVRHAIANIQGTGVWQYLGYESGVHCVKRVPATETQGRVHTSTGTVAVLPEPEKLQIDIPESDVKMDITTAQGPGGQNVNKVATAVHLIHIPTGIEVRMQESKSQLQNRTRAWQLMRARVYDFYQKQKDAQRAEARSKMIGSGERSERIRTYRYKEGIVVDDRLPGQYPLQKILAGNLDEIVEKIIEIDQEKRVALL